MTPADVITQTFIEIDGVTTPANPFKRLHVSGDYLAGCFDILDGLLYASGVFFYNEATQ
jgi:hypothetical protein